MRKELRVWWWWFPTFLTSAKYRPNEAALGATTHSLILWFFFLSAQAEIQARQQNVSLFPKGLVNQELRVRRAWWWHGPGISSDQGQANGYQVPRACHASDHGSCQLARGNRGKRRRVVFLCSVYFFWSVQGAFKSLYLATTNNLYAYILYFLV